jgi:hypothetical protein
MKHWSKEKENRDRRKANQYGSANLFRQGSTLNTGRLGQIAARQQRETEQQHHKHRRYLAYRFAVVILVVAVLFYLFSTRISGINVVDQAGHKLPDNISKIYSSEALGIIDHNWLNAFQPFVPVNQITQQTLQKHPEISNLTIHNNGFSTTLTLKMSFRRPALIWQTKGGSQFFLGADGTAFETDFSNTESSSLIHLIDTSGLGAEEGKTLASSQMINFVINLHNQLTKSKIPVVRYSVPATLREVDVQLKGKPYIVKFLSTNDVGQEVAELQQSLAFFGKHPEQTPQKYLDLRLVGRAFYQ